MPVLVREDVYHCDWCGVPVKEDNLKFVDYDYDTGIYGSAICTECYKEKCRDAIKAHIKTETVSRQRDLIAGELYKTVRRVQDLEKQLSNCDGARRYDQERLADCRRANRAQ